MNTRLAPSRITGRAAPASRAPLECAKKRIRPDLEAQLVEEMVGVTVAMASNGLTTVYNQRVGNR
jgi:hypothetical protein